MNNRFAERGQVHSKDKYKSVWVADEDLQTEASKARESWLNKATPDELIDEARRTIRKESKRLLQRVKEDDQEDDQIELLETIYRVGRELIEARQEIKKALAKRVGRKRSEDFFDLLIEAALGEVPDDIRRTWAGVATYALEAGIRPQKLKGFIWIKHGLARCGAATPKERKREIAKWKREVELRREEKRKAWEEERRRQEKDDREDRMREARAARKRQRQMRSIPDGKWSLFQ
jgi:hypothetical protein